jgi:hypothetical protein
MKRIIVGSGIVLLLVIVAVVVVVSTGDLGEVATDLTIPIVVENAENIGSMSFTLHYDESGLRIVDVQSGELAENAMLESNTETPGRVIIGLIDSSGISGDGAVVVMGFNYLKEGTNASLSFGDTAIHDATTLVDIIHETVDGQFGKNGDIVSSPRIKFFD